MNPMNLPSPALRAPSPRRSRRGEGWGEGPVRGKALRSWLLALLLAAGLHPAALFAAPFQAPATARMAERLDQIADKTDPFRNPFLNRERAEAFRELLSRASRPAEILNLQGKFAIELLQAGQSEAAIGEFEKLKRLEADARNLVGAATQNAALIRTYTAIAYLRLGEQENCLAQHTTDSCLLPIRAGGVHKLERGSRGAIRVLTEQLEADPADLRARWLLNVAYMTLGEYPGKVPGPWLIPPGVFDSEYDLPRFTDVAGPAGLDADGLSGGSVLEDFDGDGNLDLMTSSLGLRDPLRFFRNNGNGTFSDRTLEAGLTGEVGGLNLIHADYNNDGHPDVFVLRGGWFGAEGRHPNSLLRNNGDGTFEDVTEAAGLLSFHPTQTAVWLDYNNDGALDLFIGNESTGAEIHPCELYRNNGNGTFTECAAAAGVALTGWVKGTAAGDFNNDGRPDLYLSRLGEPNVLFRNDGPRDPGSAGTPAGWKFTDVSETAGVTEPRYSFPTWFWDYDNDGWLDLFVAGYRIKNAGDIAADYLGQPHNGERVRLFRNKGDGTFKDVTRAANLYRVLIAMGSNFGDLDNDGYLDFYAGTGDPDLGTLVPNRMFRNAAGKFFQDVTTAGGFGHLQKGHGVSFGDIDNDGDQDVYEDMGGAFSGDNYRNVLFENPGNSNHWVKVKLEGVQSNRAALGARIKVVAAQGNREQTIHRTVTSGGSFGASPFRQEIGLGNADRIRRLEITWPVTGKTQSFENLAPNQCYVIREGSPRIATLPLKPFRFQKATTHHH